MTISHGVGKVILEFEHGSQEYEFPLGDDADAGHGCVLKRMSLTVDNQPIVSLPFYMHGKSLHTICSASGEVETAEW